MASFSNMAEGLATSFVLDPGKSRFVVRASATGLLSAFGHNPVVAIRNFQGEACFREQAPEQSSLRMVIDPSSLTITGDVSDKDRYEMERAMREDVLETDRYPEIRFESSSTGATQLAPGFFRMRIGGTLTLHGVTRDLEISCNVTVAEDSLRANGDFTIRQTDYQIRLVSVAGGTLKLKDELKFSFDLVGRRNGSPG
jgi:polyisoprenoid-binding protein YceI